AVVLRIAPVVELPGFRPEELVLLSWGLLPHCSSAPRGLPRTRWRFAAPSARRPFAGPERCRRRLFMRNFSACPSPGLLCRFLVFLQLILQPLVGLPEPLHLAPQALHLFGRRRGALDLLEGVVGQLADVRPGVVILERSEGRPGGRSGRPQAGQAP